MITKLSLKVSIFRGIWSEKHWSHRKIYRAELCSMSSSSLKEILSTNYTIDTLSCKNTNKTREGILKFFAVVLPKKYSPCRGRNAKQIMQRSYLSKETESLTHLRGPRTTTTTNAKSCLTRLPQYCVEKMVLASSSIYITQLQKKKGGESVIREQPGGKEFWENIPFPILEAIFPKERPLLS